MGVLTYAFIGVMAIVLGTRLRLPESIELSVARDSSKDFMSAIAYTKHGGIDVLELKANYPRPIPRENQVLVRVRASSLNPVDFKFRRNKLPYFLLPKPKIPGYDIAGVVVEVGKKVTNVKVGDRVAAMLPTLGSKWGAAAEFAAVKESLVGKIGESTDFVSAASIPLVSLTAIQALEKIQEPNGKKIIIHAGAGGVGTFAIQYAKHVLGMHVATTASSPKAEFLHSLGADVVIDYKKQDFSKVILNYDAVLDTMSFAYEGRTLNEGSKVLKSDGHYLNILSSDWDLVEGKEKSIGFLSFRNLLRHKVVNFFYPGLLPRYDLVGVQPDGRQLQSALDLVDSGRILAVVDRTFPLVQAKEAYSYIEKGHSTGKVVLMH